MLTVEVFNTEKKEDTQYLHKGLAQRSFVKHFRLQNNIEVEDAILKDGILYINLNRVIPEEESPKIIKIISK